MKVFFVILFILSIPANALSVVIETVPPKPKYELQSGYEWHLATRDKDLSLVWIPRLKNSIPDKPEQNLPENWDWFPVYDSCGKFVNWQAKENPSWYKKNEDAVTYLGGFIIAVLNLFLGFKAGKKRALSALHSEKTIQGS